MITNFSASSFSGRLSKYYNYLLVDWLPWWCIILYDEKVQWFSKDKANYHENCSCTLSESYAVNIYNKMHYTKQLTNVHFIIRNTKRNCSGKGPSKEASFTFVLLRYFQRYFLQLNGSEAYETYSWNINPCWLEIIHKCSAVGSLIGESESFLQSCRKPLGESCFIGNTNKWFWIGFAVVDNIDAGLM